MDVLNLWNDDPEELLMDLGFGCDELHFSGRIPARFISHQSQARGMNLQVFLEAQKNRLDLEDLDINNRFRQLEVLQQVTTAFSSLMGLSSSPLQEPQGRDQPNEVQDRRRRIRELFRLVSKKSLSKSHNNKTQDLTTPAATPPPCAAPEMLQPPPSGRVLLKHVKPGLEETGCLSPLAEEQEAGPDPHTLNLEASFITPEGELTPWPLTKGQPWLASSTCSQATSGGSNYSQSSERSLLLSSPLTSVGLNKSLPASACSSLEYSFICDPYLSPIPPCLTNSELQTLEMEELPQKSPPVSLPELEYKFLFSGSLSSELQNLTHFQSQTLLSPFHFFSTSSTSFPSQAASLFRGLKTSKTEDKDAPSPHPSTPWHESKGTTCSSLLGAPSPASTSSCPLNLDFSILEMIAMSSTQYDSSSTSDGITQSEQTKVALHENSPSTYAVSFLFHSAPYLPPHTDLDFDYLSSSGFPSLLESLSQSLGNNQKGPLFLGSGEFKISDSQTNFYKREEDTSHLFSQVDENNLLLLSSLDVDYSMKGCAPLQCLSRGTSTRVFQSTLSSRSNDANCIIDQAFTIISDLTEPYTSHQDRSGSHDNNTTCLVQDVTCVKMDNLSLDSEDTLQVNVKGDLESVGQTETARIQEVVVNNLDNSRSVSMEACNQTVPSCCFKEFLGENELKACQKKIRSKESDLRSLVLFDNVAEAQSGAEVGPKDLSKKHRSDLVFQTSVDGSEAENGEEDGLFQQLDIEGQVYWAEPIKVSNQTPVLEESGSFEISDGSQMNSVSAKGQATLDSFSSIDKVSSSSTKVDTKQPSRNATASSDAISSLTLSPFPSLSTNLDLKSSSRSFSVQMSSSSASHIVHRKDIPYMTDSKRTLLPCVLHLDTSTPFHAVQSWTEMQIKRNTLTKIISNGDLHPGLKKDSACTSASEMTQGPTMIFSSSFPQLSNIGQSDNYPSGVALNDHTVSVSVDKELGPDDEEEVVRNEDEERLSGGKQISTMAGYCSGDHQCVCCTHNKQHTMTNIPFSLDEVKEMLLCLHQFRSVLSDMEEQLSEDQTAVYSDFSDLDRRTYGDIEELRRAVKLEVAQLELQLTELVRHCADSFKMKKMHRLMDEQSLLCSQLGLFLPGRVPTSSSTTSNRTVATQVCLAPCNPPVDMQSGHASSWNSWTVDSPRQSPSGSESNCEGDGWPHCSAENLNM